MTTIVKVKPGENLTPDRIKMAMSILETGGTKKSACDVLGIRYNVARLQKIIDEFTAKEERERTFREKKKGTQVGIEEAKDIIKEYLETASVDKVSKMFYRSPHMINQVLDHYGAKLHNTKYDYFNPVMLPDICVAESFEIGERVWSTRYNSLAIIKKKVNDEVYAIRVLGKYEKDAYQSIEDLGSLQHLVAIGLKLENLRIHEFEREVVDD